jgi:hypothetical protein
MLGIAERPRHAYLSAMETSGSALRTIIVVYRVILISYSTLTFDSSDTTQCCVANDPPLPESVQGFILMLP